METVETTYENLLTIKRLSTRLKFDVHSCAGMDVPEKYWAEGEGIEADLVIFIKIDQSGYFEQNHIEAAASHCILHKENYRPLAGIIIFKKDLLMVSHSSRKEGSLTHASGKDNSNKHHHKQRSLKEAEENYVTWLALHEISHVLAFNSKLYEYFIKEDGKKLGFDNIVGSVPYKGKLVSYIKSPRLLQKAREHFNCSNLMGVPLEYHGGEGTAGAHWSKRFMNTDYMIADSYGENSFSEITLAIFEDSGWYKVDYSKANLFTWGKNKGCGFFDENFPCIETRKEEEEGLHWKEESKETRRNEEGESNEKDYMVIDKDKDKDKAIVESSDGKSSNKNSTKTNQQLEQRKNQHFLVTNRSKSSYFSQRVNKESKEQEFNVSYQSNFQDEFCEGFNMPVCSINHVFKGNCKGTLAKTDLPESERYFKNKKLGGFDQLTGRCPIPTESRKEQKYYGGSCKLGLRNKDYGGVEVESSKYGYVEEKICANCICVMSSLRYDKEEEQEKADDNRKSHDREESESDHDRESNISSNGSSDFADSSTEENKSIELVKPELFEVTEQGSVKRADDSDILNTYCVETLCENQKLFLLISLRKTQYKVHCEHKSYFKLDK
eukprot:CAMPEP_0170522668 /NCGR_PEP_ID=MMETSP0209-20121228/8095_1 /TAXON_ID=665100 ORGANISM="Litonotus pictus, Strain P1" /NCGR_SAMPLE_ID=MMETSP0209 /ASSEMBLY_ACC=CAM_ASM_000301 /LENGTH=608 /DNA_ID=CAMNT_0010810301 /DNA_START=317 /DNA_END=2140 /DNA_ORIENTATION=-